MGFQSLLVILFVFIILAIVILFVVLLIFAVFVILLVFAVLAVFALITLMHHHFFSRIVIRQHNLIQMEFSFNNTERIRADGPKLSDDFYIIKAQIPIPVAETSL